MASALLNSSLKTNYINSFSPIVGEIDPRLPVLWFYNSNKGSATMAIAPRMRMREQG